MVPKPSTFLLEKSIDSGILGEFSMIYVGKVADL
jgi:hypothetical protein